MRKTWIAAFLLSICLFAGMTSVYAEAQISDIEIFDIAKGEVIKRVPNNVSVQKEVQLCLESITNLVQPMQEAPKEGTIIRIPLQPPIFVESKWLTTMAHEVFLVILPGKKPFMIVFSQERTPYLVDFSHSPNKLLSLMGVQ